MDSTPDSHERGRAIAELGRAWDAVVVGGGVNGLAVAWDLALGGLSVLIVDKGDWGSGTSSWSSRMVHGGLKYLEKYDVRLVRESLREREWLLRSAPHLVKPLPFLLPFYKGGAHSKTALRAGMIAYDVLSFDKSVPRHTILSRDEVIEELPEIRREGLQGAARYYDAQVEYSERLCVELLLGAQSAGAVAINHMKVERLRLDAAEELDLAAELLGTLAERTERRLLLLGHRLAVLGGSLAHRLHLGDNGGELVEKLLDLVHGGGSCDRDAATTRHLPRTYGARPGPLQLRGRVFY